ncbi:GntR family transcriptional regulator [Baekduia soli]|uniref:GntR family transcriptional regulator n=1 Tax=Baekduia soli TaxID=496014 RepID=A0A5B8U426_9ACTN|nr:GntR family transcriptional regulator [Baekduia soli]QEC47770.1 GntR family transcriptional regulator [Baekduia soli]
MATVDRSSPLPAYFQVAEDLRRRLAGGEWRTGERIAPEIALARDYAVSRVTVRQALAQLAKDDLLERKRGSGTYVRPQPLPIVYDLNLTLGAYAARLRDLGFSNRAEIIESGTLESPPAGLAATLALSAGRTVTYLVRRVIINEQPAAIYRSWFDAAMVPGIERSPGIQGSLSNVLAEDYGLVPVRSELSLEVVRSTTDEARLLDSGSDVPLLVVTSTSHLRDGRPLERAQMSWLGDRVRFHVTSEAPGRR